MSRLRRLFSFESDPLPDPRDPGERALRASAPTTPAVDPSRADTAVFSVWRPPIRRRLGLFVALLAIWAVGIQVRLVFLQVVHAAEYAQMAERQQERTLRPEGRRGDIVDRQGRLLAYSVQSLAIEADPSVVEDPAGTVRRLCDALGDCTDRDRAEYAARLGADARWARIRRGRQVSPDQAQRVAAAQLDGILLLPEPVRFYPQVELGAQVVGFVGADHDGRAGIESRFDRQIRGTAGLTLIQQDAKRRLLTTRVEVEPAQGATIELTLDLNMQHIAERELRAGIEEHRAEAGTAIVLDPWTGEILANANYPTFNPNVPGQSPPDAWKNRAMQDIYEPGSTFKIVTAAAALEEGILRPSDVIDVSPGYIKLPGRAPIYDEHAYTNLTFEDVIVKSSNVGAIKAGLRVGADRFSRWVRRFGFGQGLVPDFAGESAGIVHAPASLNESGLASMSMGYQVSVTPVQMAAAVGAIANGGDLMEPHLVRAIVRDGVRQEVAPKVLRRALSPETAATITGIMEAVVERGTAKTAQLDRYQVAGKTGTSKKAIPGGYSATDRNSSFVGFVPSRRPEFVILVVIDTPRSGQVYGGTVAAPVFKRIADAVLREAGVPATRDPEPPVVTRPAQRTLPESVPEMVPASHAPDAHAVMPDLRGLGARQAVRVLTRLGLATRVNGDGVVVSHSPEAGSPVGTSTVGVLQLRRAPATGGRPPGAPR